MQIASSGMSPATAVQPQVQARPPEAAERGPDRDNDGDEGKVAATTAQPLPAPPPGRGGKVDMLA